MDLSEEQISKSVQSIDRVLELRDTYTLPEIPPLPLSGECLSHKYCVSHL